MPILVIPSGEAVRNLLRLQCNRCRRESIPPFDRNDKSYAVNPPASIGIGKH
jgi:hypothetical protein